MSTPGFVGIDVSKDVLDLHARPTGPARRLPNDPGGIAAVVSWVRERAPARVVAEATGGLEYPVVVAPSGAGMGVAVINPTPSGGTSRGRG